MKRKGMTMAILTIFLVVFHIIFLVLMSDHSGEIAPGIWISYIFILVSYLAVVITVMRVTNKGKMAELSVPAMAISIAYFLAECLVAICFMLLFRESIKGCIIVNVILLGAYLIVFLTNAMADDATATQIENQRADRVYVKECSADLKGIMDRTQNRTIYKKMEEAYDLIHSSPIKSNEQVMEYEIEVIRLIKVLGKNVDDGNEEEIEKTIQSIMRYAGERNRCLMKRL